MVVKDKVKNREYVAKSRQKLINRIGIGFLFEKIV